MINLNTKVNLFVVGAMRSGTTSFIEVLRGHPAIHVSPIKEPNYFVEEMPAAIFKPQPKNFLKNYFERIFPKPIHRAHLKNSLEYEKLFHAGALAMYRAEGSVSYLNAPGVASKIKCYNSNAKIIILTRDPMARAFSHYRMDKNLGRTSLSFENEMQKQVKAFETGTLPWYSYLAMSLYTKHIERYRAHFGTNVLVVDYEQLVSRPELKLKEVSEFLEILAFDSKALPKWNQNYELRFGNLQRIIMRQIYSKNLISWLPISIKTRFKNYALRNKKIVPKLSQSLLITLTSIFENDR